LTGVAVKATNVPEQIAPAGTAAILTLTAGAEFTVMLIALEVAGLPELQVAPEVITTVIISPLANDEEVYVGFVAPEMGDAPLYH
jgi:hypothetical protein